VEVYHNEPARIFEVTVNGEVIRTTANHPFYVKGTGWVKTESLSVGNDLRGIDGGSIKIEKIKNTGITEPVFNLHVAVNHTYFVVLPKSGSTVQAHNQSGKSELEKGLGESKERAETVEELAEKIQEFSETAELGKVSKAAASVGKYSGKLKKLLGNAEFATKFANAKSKEERIKIVGNALAKKIYSKGATYLAKTLMAEETLGVSWLIDFDPNSLIFKQQPLLSDQERLRAFFKAKAPGNLVTDHLWDQMFVPSTDDDDPSEPPILAPRVKAPAAMQAPQPEPTTVTPVLTPDMLQMMIIQGESEAKRRQEEDAREEAINARRRQSPAPPPQTPIPTTQPSTFQPKMPSLPPAPATQPSSPPMLWL
jgi:hypothetical protein